MTRYLLDTNVWIAAARGDSGVLRRFAQLHPSGVVSCAVVRAELIFGARKSARVAANLAGFRGSLEPFESLPFDDTVAGEYGLIRTQLESGGTPIGANDLQIAAIALAADCMVVTRNRHELERVPGLQVGYW